MTTEILTHPLAARFPRLVKPELSGRLNTYYNTLQKAMDEYEAAVDKARKVSPDYIPAKRAARQHEILTQARKKLNDTLAKELQPLGASIENLRSEITAAGRAKAPETEIGQLLAYLKESELRQELKGMDGELRAKLLRESVARGDRSILTALERSLTPICAPMLLDSAREAYAGAIAAPAFERLAETEELLDSARETARRANYEADKLVKGTKEILPLPAEERPPSPVANLTDSQKADLISKVGVAGYQSILKGEATLPLDYVLTDETKAAMLEWAGESAYAEIMAGTRDLPEKFAPAAAE
jgi:hypothetical protein